MGETGSVKAEPSGQEYCCKHPQDHFCHTCHKRHEGITHSLKGVAQYEQNAEQCVEKSLYLQETCSGTDGDCVFGGVFEKEQYKAVGENDHYCSRYDGIDECHYHRAFGSASYSVEVAGSVVLGDKGRNCDTDGKERHKGYRTQRLDSRYSADRVGTEAVEDALDDQNSNSGDRELKSHRKSDSEVFEVKTPVGYPIFRAQLQKVVLFDGVEIKEYNSDDLRDGCRPCDSGNSPSSAENQSEVQADVEDV